MGVIHWLSMAPRPSESGMSTLETQSAGVGASGLADQYADGKAAKNWKLYIGEKDGRTTNYKSFLTKLLRERKAHSLLDAACGTGIDSVILIEEGFKLTSANFSDKMLKVAYKTRWDRRREPAFFEWEIHSLIFLMNMVILGITKHASATLRAC